MVSGSIGKMGDAYTIDAKMFSVETGETVRSKNATHKGDISGLLTEMQITLLPRVMVQLEYGAEVIRVITISSITWH